MHAIGSGAPCLGGEASLPLPVSIQSVRVEIKWSAVKDRRMQVFFQTNGTKNGTDDVTIKDGQEGEEESEMKVDIAVAVRGA